MASSIAISADGTVMENAGDSDMTFFSAPDGKTLGSTPLTIDAGDAQWKGGGTYPYRLTVDGHKAVAVYGEYDEVSGFAPRLIRVLSFGSGASGVTGYSDYLVDASAPLTNLDRNWDNSVISDDGTAVYCVESDGGTPS